MYTGHSEILVCQLFNDVINLHEVFNSHRGSVIRGSSWSLYLAISNIAKIELAGRMQTFQRGKVCILGLSVHFQCLHL